MYFVLSFASYLIEEQSKHHWPTSNCSYKMGIKLKSSTYA